MQMTKKYFKTILAELIDENPVACRGVLRISELDFTVEVPTLAVTLSARPVLKVNLDFIAKNCHTEAHVKAVIIHEFLHVILNHTENIKACGEATNLAMDAVINAIIHRLFGTDYSSMMSMFYADAKRCYSLLRPPTRAEIEKNQFSKNLLSNIRENLYEGKLVADDILDIVRTLNDSGTRNARGGLGGKKPLLGNHNDSNSREPELDPQVEKVLQETMKEMNGSGIWRSPNGIGTSANVYQTIITAKDEKVARWERTAWKVLRECLTPDRRSKLFQEQEQITTLPVLNERDRRSVLRSIWNPLIPESSWVTCQKKPEGSVQIYLDVSGSMQAEMQQLVFLLIRLRKYIRMPFWAFSDQVAPAVIEGGQLKTVTSGGTSMNSVLQHVLETKPGKAVVITDGYIEVCDPQLLRVLNNQKIQAIISRDGSSAELERAGIPFTQLEEFPND